MIKLGGSLAGSPLLAHWLGAIAAGGGRAVLVPGGGGFADAVRDAQRRWRFGDAAAHRMALLAMEQYGLMLAAMEPRLSPAASRHGIRRVLAAGGVPVWLPSRMLIGRPDIPESWDVTSDSLAAWLAGELGAAGLLLVKSVPMGAGETLADLIRAGAVDSLLPRYLRRVPECRWIEVSRHAELAHALAGGAAPGDVVRCGPPALADRAGTDCDAILA